MSTYEIVLALFSPNSSSTSTVEVTTIQTRKVLLTQVDSEANASNASET
jgi:hypothetical protein